MKQKQIKRQGDTLDYFLSITFDTLIYKSYLLVNL